ncbi:MAG: ABC transporter ATP-binding protein [Armatimonadetes bacterium]|nr:ABC transporter ATP-binding protein [Armatimonadota bacterium]
MRGLTFSIAPGERVALLGANGAGKSTLLWCLVGVLPCTGAISVGGVDLGRNTMSEVRRRLGLGFAEPDDQLFTLTVERDITFGLLAAGDAPEEARRKAQEAARLVDLPEVLFSRAPHELSSGERRRAALAAVLVSRPEVLALDEPTNSLDAPGKAALADTLAGLECAQLVASHDLEFVGQLCERALVLVDGELVADVGLGDLLSDEKRLTEYRLAARRGAPR